MENGGEVQDPFRYQRSSLFKTTLNSQSDTTVCAARLHVSVWIRTVIRQKKIVIKWQVDMQHAARLLMFLA